MNTASLPWPTLNETFLQNVPDTTHTAKTRFRRFGLFIQMSDEAGLTGVLSRIADHKITRLDELAPWRYAEV